MLVGNKEPQLLILLLLASFAAVSAVLFTPALPTLTQILKISSSQGQFLITAFLIGYALGNLPYGPLSNRFGRKTTIYIGLLIAIFGSLLALIAIAFHSFSLLIVGRFLEAMGSSVGLTLTFTMIGDLYVHSQATKKTSYVVLSFAVAPSLAIASGGLLTKYLGWQSCFYFLFFYGILLLFLSFLLPETGKERDLQALNIQKMTEGFLAKLKNKKIVSYAILMGLGTSIVYLFASEAPFIGIDRIGLKEDVYGLLNFIPPVGMIVGSLISNYLAEKKEGHLTIGLGILITLIGSIGMLVLFLLNSVNVWSLFMPMPLIYVGLAFISSNASALAMSHAQNKSNASAIMNFLNVGISVLALLAIQALPFHEALALPFFFLILSFAMIILRFIFLKPRKERAS